MCEKVVDLTSESKFIEDVAETILILEKDMPPSFFDIMTHLMVHLVQEVYILGIVDTRWMYPKERYYKGLKGFVKYLAKPEASIAKEYEVEVALGFVTEYMVAYTPTPRRISDITEDQTMINEIVEGKGKPRDLSD